MPRRRPLAGRLPAEPGSWAARSSTISAPRSRCCCSCASARSASPGCGSRPRRSARSPGAGACGLLREPLLISLGAILALMNCCFYLAIDRLPLGTVAAIEFLPVIVLAVLGARTAQRAALLLAVGGVSLLTGVRMAGDPLGFVFAFANAGLFALYIVLGHRVRRAAGIDGSPRRWSGRSSPSRRSGLGGAARIRRPGGDRGRRRRRALLVGDSVRLRPDGDGAAAALDFRAACLALLPATATMIGMVVLGQLPSREELAGVALVVSWRRRPPRGVRRRQTPRSRAGRRERARRRRAAQRGRRRARAPDRRAREPGGDEVVAADRRAARGGRRSSQSAGGRGAARGGEHGGLGREPPPARRRRRTAARRASAAGSTVAAATIAVAIRGRERELAQPRGQRGRGRAAHGRGQRDPVGGDVARRGGERQRPRVPARGRR